jgi:RibD C-terminal domain
LVASLPYSGAQTVFFSLDLTVESFLEGHAHAFGWLGGVPRECVYDSLRSVVARRERDQIVWSARFLHLRGHYGFHATACTPATPREKGSVEAAVRYLKSGFWPARRFRDLGELDQQYVAWRDGVCNRRVHATRRDVVAERLAEERQVLRPLPPGRFDWSGHRSAGSTSMRMIGSLTLCRSLLNAGLVDRFRVVVFPVITGSTGRERIYDGYPDVALEMIGSRTFDGRIQLLEYVPTILAGPPGNETVTP